MSALGTCAHVIPGMQAETAAKVGALPFGACE